MLKVKVRKVGAALLGAAGAVAVAGCAVQAQSDSGSAPPEVSLDSTTSAYSVANPGSAALTFVSTYGSYQYELSLSNSTTDEFVRSGESLTISFPAYYIWQNLHPENYEEPALQRVQQTQAKVQVFFFKDGEPVGSLTVTASSWSGEAYWILYATTESFVVPAGVDQLKFSVDYSDAGDPNAHAQIEAAVVRPIPVFGGDLPDKSVLFDNDNQGLRQRVLEGGGPVTGADVKLGYTDYRADTIVDASKIDRQIGTYKAYTRFGQQLAPLYGELVHEVSVGVFFDDGQGWRPEVPMTPNKSSQFLQQQNWRTVFESSLAIPTNATKLGLYYHVKTYLIANYNVYGPDITWKKYKDGEKILVAERWDNPSGPSSNYGLGVQPSEGNPELKRTVVMIRGETQPGQDLFLRGGIDHTQAEKAGLKCVNTDNAPNYKCAIPIVHRNLKNVGTNAWKPGDKFLDWYGRESTQTGTLGGLGAQGSPADWTTNLWPASFGPQKTVGQDGYGLEPLNTFGMHYWMLDVNMDCSRAFQDGNGVRWFEVKSFISNGPGWEGDIHQAGAPYSSVNHFAQCGKLSVFERDSSSVQFLDLQQ